MFVTVRFKALVGVKLVGRKFNNQQVEALVTCRVIKRMTELGMLLLRLRDILTPWLLHGRLTSRPVQGNL